MAEGTIDAAIARWGASVKATKEAARQHAERKLADARLAGGTVEEDKAS